MSAVTFVFYPQSSIFLSDPAIEKPPHWSILVQLYTQHKATLIAFSSRLGWRREVKEKYDTNSNAKKGGKNIAQNKSIRRREWRFSRYFRAN